MTSLATPSPSRARDLVRETCRRLYRRPAVRQRMWEYLGGDSAGKATAFFVVGGPGGLGCRVRPRPPSAMHRLWREGLEIGRSLWDGASLLAHLDLEYINFDRPDLAFADSPHAFGTQRAVVGGLLGQLHGLGIAPLHLWTGRGHHLVWRISRQTPIFERLRMLGTATGLHPQIDPPAEAAHAGLGMVLEWLGHENLARASASAPVPIQLSAIEVGPGARGREVVAIDLSLFGDPLYLRTIRLPFSAYLKGHPADPGGGPLLFAVPALEATGDPGAWRDVTRAGELAQIVETRIPEQAAGTARLLDAYLESPLAEWHRQYHDRPASPPTADDEPMIAGLPPCIRRILDQPNDLLLRPAAIQMVVRAFLSLGWHPRRISGLIRHHYEKDHGWSADLHFRRADVRSDFYTRLFAGLVLTHRDELVDFNCRSTQEKGYCGEEGCAWNLLDLQAPLMARLKETP